VFELLSLCLSLAKNGSFGFLSVGSCVGKNQMCHLRVGFLACALTDGGMKSCRLRAISCQVTQKLKRATTLEQPTVPAIFYTACYRAFFIVL